MPSRNPRDKSLRRLHPRRADRLKLSRWTWWNYPCGIGELDYHFGQITLLGGITLEMVIFGGIAAAVAHDAGDLPIAWLGSMMAPA
jgi:hypothetical protein